MKIPYFDFNFIIYWFYRNGGYKIDKRTWEGKQDIKTVKEMNRQRMINVGNEYNISPELVCTSIKTRRNLFTFEFLN